MSTEKSQISSQSGGDNGADAEEVAAGQVSINSAGTDDLLDEIDGLLENNAEEFVRSYVQKGGE
ncbi:ubiquitin-like protein Pup [Corynebacterium flavescens]